MPVTMFMIQWLGSACKKVKMKGMHINKSGAIKQGCTHTVHINVAVSVV